MKYFMPQTAKTVPAVNDPAQTGSVAAVKPAGNVVIPAWEQRPQSLDPGAQYSHIPYAVAPMWPAGTEMDIAMYISSSVAMPPLKSMPKDSLLIEEKNFKFGDYKENREIYT